MADSMLAIISTTELWNRVFSLPAAWKGCPTTEIIKYCGCQKKK